MQHASGIILSVCPLVCFRGYEVQEARSEDEEEMERRSVEKGISSPALYSVSPTCRAGGNHFSILHPPDFLPNVLSAFLLCVYVCRTPCPSLTRFFSPQPLLCPHSFHFAVRSHPCAVYFFLVTCSTLREILFHCCSHEGLI